MPLLAHGVGTRADLPIPLALAVQGAGIAVFMSFLALTILWKTPRLRGDVAGRPLPLAVQRAVDSATVRTVTRLVMLALAGLLVVVGLTGPGQATDNIAPQAFYITFWVGLIPASLLLGAFWRYASPLRLLQGGLARLSGADPDAGLVALPQRLGYWPAVASLAAFLWLELVVPSETRASPYVVSVFVALYGFVHLAAGTIYGARWFSRSEGFEVYSTLIGRLSPFGRRADGRLVVRNPLDGLEALRPEPGFVALVSVLIGSTGFDGLTRTELWTDRVDADSVPVGTVALLGCIAAVAVTYTLAARATARLGGGDTAAGDYPGTFAGSLVPIALGYAVAHYFSLLLLDGQRTLILASDPFGTGSNLFGTADWKVNFALVSTSVIALVQVAAIVAGHILGVVSAHDRAVRLLPPERSSRGQYPLLVVMVLYTVTGVGLLFGA
jgi:hypothetical protein